MTTKSIILFLILALAWASPLSAATIYSTPSGGGWGNITTWAGGILPANGDDIIIAGPVVMVSTRTCQSLSIEPLGSLKNGTGAPYLIVNGNVHNEGTISNGAAYVLYLRVFGDLYNAGVWSNHRTYLAGSGPRNISQEPDADFDTWVSYSAGSGDLIALNEVSVGSLDLTGGQLILQPGAHFTISGGLFHGTLLANGNEVRSVPNASFSNCTVDDAVMTGDPLAGFNVTFTTQVTVMGTLLNSSGGGTVSVDGTLTNHGLIDWQHSSFQNFEVLGDLENYGTIGIPVLILSGAGAVHHLSMSAEAIIESSVFLPESENATLIADTPVQISSSLSLGAGTLILEPGSSFSGSVHSGFITGNGHPVRIIGNSFLSNVTLEQGVLEGIVTLSGTCLFTDGLTVNGSIVGPTWSTSEFSIDGLFTNNGSINGGSNSMDIAALGDLLNLGTMINCDVTLAGAVDQAVAAGTGMMMDHLIIDSGLQADSYQWFKNGSAILGETAPTLVFATVGPGMFAEYHCIADGESSRLVTIDETFSTTAVPDLAGLISLEQNYPNPFNPITEIAFNLKQDGPISLIVYDLAGREVQRLVDGSMDAGTHSVTWQPKDLPSGTYFYGLKAGTNTTFKKCVLLK